ncbi:ribonuclease G [Lentilactobacillus senioris]|uniref:ribonuclease G n=1 Tax=Lentilactobacillus senioris TaxID=931534 RepID=UPI00227E441C|nr:ribonuclease G [Lentilactobacillus senioris]MCY9807251.1 ribonuclease G [Lentilactobacillus senioris]
MQETGKETPQEIKGWNWGAFMFNWVWGIGNKTYLPLLNLIPLVNIVWIFVTGFKGNEWAWQKGDYKDVKTFKQVQATWNRAGLVQFAIYIIFIILYVLIFAGVFASYFNS